MKILRSFENRAPDKATGSNCVGNSSSPSRGIHWNQVTRRRQRATGLARRGDGSEIAAAGGRQIGDESITPTDHGPLTGRSVGPRLRRQSLLAPWDSSRCSPEFSGEASIHAPVQAGRSLRPLTIRGRGINGNWTFHWQTISLTKHFADWQGDSLTIWQDGDRVDKCTHLASCQRIVLSTNWLSSNLFVSETSRKWINCCIFSLLCLCSLHW